MPTRSAAATLRVLPAAPSIVPVRLKKWVETRIRTTAAVPRLVVILPAVDRLAVDRPVVDRLVVDRLVVDRLAVERPVVERPVVERPGEALAAPRVAVRAGHLAAAGAAAAVPVDRPAEAGAAVAGAVARAGGRPGKKGSRKSRLFPLRLRVVFETCLLCGGGVDRQG